MNEKDRLSFLAGEVHALSAFCCAMIKAHHDPEKLKTSFDQTQEIALALSVQSAVPESYLSGFRQAKGVLEVFLPTE